ncbi:MAG: 5-formyltetrahydrofolate cyclo-ligase [Bacillota bacterium]
MKAEIRKMILEQRNKLEQADVENMSNAIAKKLLELEEYRKSNNIFIYLDFNKEVKTDGIIKYAMESGKKIFIPLCITETKQLVTVELTSQTHLKKNRFGIPEVMQEHIYIADRNIIDAAVVPGVAFDPKGSRLGFGAGYYDKYFSALERQIPKIALAFSFQLIDHIEYEAHDIAMDYIITEKEIINCRQQTLNVRQV